MCGEKAGNGSCPGPVVLRRALLSGSFFICSTDNSRALKKLFEDKDLTKTEAAGRTIQLLVQVLVDL